MVRLYPILLLLVGLVRLAEAHNGAVAVAVPVEGITIDGDLSDWPEGMREYPITLPEFGDSPLDAGDYQASFRIGYSEPEQALYIAVEVQDEFIDSTSTGAWDAGDGCEVYLNVGHGRTQPLQFRVYGNHVGGFNVGEKLKGLDLKIQRGVQVHRYEWRLDIDIISNNRVEFLPGTILGLDISVIDKDIDGSFSWMAWGSETAKMNSIELIGDVVLAENHKEIGSIKGHVKWAGNHKSIPRKKIRIESADSSSVWVQVFTDAEGSYEVEVPAGQYRVNPRIRPAAGNERIVKVKEDSQERVDFVISPPRGKQAKAGVGMTKMAGSGIRHVGWENFGLYGDVEWQYYDSSNGLTLSSVLDMYEDHQGYIWFATNEGIFRYDGHNFISNECVGNHGGVKCL
jgi:hypothetical protein